MRDTLLDYEAAKSKLDAATDWLCKAKGTKNGGQVGNPPKTGAVSYVCRDVYKDFGCGKCFIPAGLGLAVQDIILNDPNIMERAYKQLEYEKRSAAAKLIENLEKMKEELSDV